MVHGVSEPVNPGYTTIERTWQSGDVVQLNMDIQVERILPPMGADNEELFAAYRRGPIVLAADARLVDPRSVIDIDCNADGLAEGKLVYCPEIRDSIICVELNTVNGEKVRLIDYSSAGKTWTKDSECAAWLYKKEFSEVAE